MTRAELITFLRAQADAAISNDTFSSRIIPGKTSDLNELNKSYPILFVMVGEARTGLRAEYTDYPLFILALNKHNENDTIEKYEIESEMQEACKTYLGSILPDESTTTDIIGIVDDTGQVSRALIFNTQENYLNDRLTGVSLTITIRVFTEC